MSLWLIGALLGQGAQVANAAPATTRGGSVTVQVTSEGLWLTWEPPIPALLSHISDSTALPGYQLDQQPGQPQLPFTIATVALPTTALPTLEIIQHTEQTRVLTTPLTFSAFPSGVKRDAAGQVIGGAWAADPGANATCSAARSCPTQVVNVATLGTVRGVHLAQVRFNPVRLAGAHLLITTRLQVLLKFDQSLVSVSSPAMRDPFLQAIKSFVINPDQVLPAPVSTRALPTQNDLQALIEVSQTGLTTLTYEALQASGYPVAAVDPFRLHLKRAGVEIALQQEDDGDTFFEPGERLLFFADPRFSRWTLTDVYFLSAEATLGLRMETRAPLNRHLYLPMIQNTSTASHAARPQVSQSFGAAWVTAVFERNALYMPACQCGMLPAGRDGDYWAWDVVRRPDRAKPTYALNPLTAIDTTRPATLTLWFIGYTDIPAVIPDHHVDIALNGVPLGQVEWNGKQAVTVTLPISPGVLLEANNALSLTLPGLPNVGVVEGMWLDAFELRYMRSQASADDAILFTGEVAQTYRLNLTSTLGLRHYDVTQPERPVIVLTTTPQQITDPDNSPAHRYLVTNENGIQAPTRIRLATSLQPVSGADYILIAPSDFISALQPLVALHQANGLSVTVENVQAVYDANDGRPTPDAIHAYLQNAYATWQPRPTYVLLVGDGTVDPTRHQANSQPTFIPPYLAKVDPWIGEVATDNRYVTFDGDDDLLPDLLIGRLPVNSVTETQAVVNKIVAYTTYPNFGNWKQTAAFVTDNADSAGNFSTDADDLVQTFIHAPFISETIYYTSPLILTETRQLVQARWAQGAGLITYLGHSTPRQWAGERFFHLEDVATLTNGSHLPVVVELTCLTGSFAEAGLATLDESLVRRAEGGALAVWGPTGLGVASGHQMLAAGFLTVTQHAMSTTLGEAALSGKLQLWTSGSASLDLMDTYNLLGDPALALRLTVVLTANHTLYLPVIQR